MYHRISDAVFQRQSGEFFPLCPSRRLRHLRRPALAALLYRPACPLKNLNCSPRFGEIPMFDRLDQMEALYEDLGRQLSEPALLSDQKKFQAVAKQHRDLEPT